eukprot:358445-Chlamydomonas_euryale.AAC.22
MLHHARMRAFRAAFSARIRFTVSYGSCRSANSVHKRGSVTPSGGSATPASPAAAASEVSAVAPSAATSNAPAWSVTGNAAMRSARSCVQCDTSSACSCGESSSTEHSFGHALALTSMRLAAGTRSISRPLQPDTSKDVSWSTSGGTSTADSALQPSACTASEVENVTVGEAGGSRGEPAIAYTPVSIRRWAQPRWAGHVHAQCDAAQP